MHRTSLQSAHKLLCRSGRRIRLSGSVQARDLAVHSARLALSQSVERQAVKARADLRGESTESLTERESSPPGGEGVLCHFCGIATLTMSVVQASRR